MIGIKIVFYEWVFCLQTLFRGMNAIQGPVYCGTGCFHRRKALYGVPPVADQYNNKDVREYHNHGTGKSSYTGCACQLLQRVFCFITIHPSHCV